MQQASEIPNLTRKTHRDFVPSRRLRVLIVAPSLEILGGQAVQAARLVSHLKEEPWLEVSLLPINPRLPFGLSKLQKIKYIRTFVTSLLYGISLITRVDKYDLIHVFSASYFSFVLAPTPALLVARLYGKKTVLNYRSGEAEDHLTRWRRSALRTIRLADQVVVPSGYLVDVFASFGLHARSISNFLESGRFFFRRRSPLRPLFLSNRNFEPLYNVGCILRAFALIQKRYPEARLTLAGDGSQRTNLEKLASELGLREVLFLGRVDPTRMPALYDANHIYLNSPNIDNMPGSIIEAFTAGLPVVTTNAGGIPYIVTDGETGLIVQRGDHEGMAACAIRLLEDEAWAVKIAEKAREESRKYTWGSVRNEWLNLYFGLVDNGASNVTEKAAQHGSIAAISQNRAVSDD